MSEYVPQVGDKVSVVGTVVRVDHFDYKVAVTVDSEYHPDGTKTVWIDSSNLTLIDRPTPTPPLKVGDQVTFGGRERFTIRAIVDDVGWIWGVGDSLGHVVKLNDLVRVA